MITMGNTKLGYHGRIWSFGLPSRDTCPGRSELCSTQCYSHRLERFRPNIRTRYERNLALSFEPQFAREMVRLVVLNAVQVLRIHVAGDFYSAEYTKKWLQIIRRLRDVTFYAYTRSWRSSEINPVLCDMADLPNAQIWYSCDRETGIPETVHSNVRLAWLMTTPQDIPPRADLVFRTHRLRRTLAKSVLQTELSSQALVCPVENGITGRRTDCGRCGICWKAKATPTRAPHGRIHLPVVSSQ